jgi:hypothetical protein
MGVLVTCKKCAKVFSVKPYFVKIGFGKYCSAKCQHDDKRNGKIVKCEGCGKDVYRTIKGLRSSRSKKYFCSKSCQTVWRNREFSGARHAHYKNGSGSYRIIMIRAGRKQICEMCAFSDVRAIEVHHKDKNRMNNSISNLSWLCRNCHYIVHHYPIGRERGFIV